MVPPVASRSSTSTTRAVADRVALISIVSVPYSSA
jgi:hypothetical protein